MSEQAKHTPTLNRTIFAHRGLNRVAPENTLPAFQAAADAGATWIEADVDTLGDGTPVVIHDTTLDRTTNRTGSIYDLRASDLSEVDAGAWFSPQFRGTPLPTLASLANFLNNSGMNANIELKSHESGRVGTLTMIDRVAEELSHLHPNRQIIISSFSPLVLANFHERHPGYAIAQLYEGGTVGPDWLSVLELTGASYVHPDVRGLSRDQVAMFRDAGYGVNVWTVNESPIANELFNWGATGIFTDEASRFLSAV